MEAEADGAEFIGHAPSPCRDFLSGPPRAGCRPSVLPRAPRGRGVPCGGWRPAAAPSRGLGGALAAADLRRWSQVTQELLAKSIFAALPGLGACCVPDRAAREGRREEDGEEQPQRSWSSWGKLAVRVPALRHSAPIDALGVLTAALAPLATSGSQLLLSGGSGVSIACCPLDLGYFSLGGGSKDVAPFGEFSLQGLERGLLVATYIQGSLGLLRICLGDVFSGSYGLLLATLGYNSRRPGPASNWLKTYVLITFINGTMSSIDLIQNMLIHNYPLLLLTLPIRVNLAHLVTLTVPGISFLGAYCGWQHIKLQRKVAIQAYQEQLMMLMEQPPWPPPPLPLLPGMQGLPGLPGMPMMVPGGYMEEEEQARSNASRGGRLQPVPEAPEMEADEEGRGQKQDEAVKAS